MLVQLTDILTTIITNLYVSTGLLGIVLAMAIESCCIPLPSEIVMPLAGIMISSHKILPGTNLFLALVLVALSGAVGCLLGSMLAYAIGYKGGRPLMLKYGRYVLISQHDADKADHFFQRWGSATAFFSRLLPVVRTYISLPAGIAKMPFAKFCLYTFLGSFPWCLLLAYVGTIIGNNLATLSPIFHSLDVVVLVVVVLLIVLYLWRHIKNDRAARAVAAVAPDSAQQAPPAPYLSRSSQIPNGQQGQPQSVQPFQPQWGPGQFAPPQPPSVQSPPPQQPQWGPGQSAPPQPPSVQSPPPQQSQWGPGQFAFPPQPPSAQPSQSQWGPGQQAQSQPQQPQWNQQQWGQSRQAPQTPPPSQIPPGQPAWPPQSEDRTRR